MIGRLKLWYPFLFAALPILHILTRNPGGTRLDDAAFVLAASLLVCAALYGVAWVALRGRASRALVPLVVLAGILLIYGKSALVRFSRQTSGLPLGVVLAGIAALILLLLWWLARRPGALDRINTFFSLTGSLMVIWLGFRFVADQVRARSEIRDSMIVRQLAQPVPLRQDATGAGEPRRDVYLLVLDEYANSVVLRELFQFDNHAFEDSLRQLGFTIPPAVQSNYVHTLLSLPSLLNFSHLNALADELGPRSNDATLPNYLLENNRTVAFLQARGYRFLFFPSQWWPSTGRNRNADWVFQPWSGFDLSREVTRSDLRRSLLSSTAFDVLPKGFHWDADHIQQTLRGLEQVAQRPEPTFAFTHLVSPHWPYVFKADCRVASQAVIQGRAGRQQAYTEQLQCLNRLLLRTVRSILLHSPVQPIILLQGDHGTNLLRYSDAPSAEAVTPEQARERFGAFGAYYLPAGGGRLFSDSVTIVNVLQKVLTHYFGAELGPSSDARYVSLERTPYRFVKLDPAASRP